ncbi:hypothetical protein OJAV_G00096430 [Oryzias javanicus]|nr:hypothetical protein OJAV_G00096430 [Oryzias javanicus]
MASQANQTCDLHPGSPWHPALNQDGTILKGEHRLPTYRCARGSTSLQSFHLHLNRFIPGLLVRWAGQME